MVAPMLLLVKVPDKPLIGMAWAKLSFAGPVVLVPPGKTGAAKKLIRLLPLGVPNPVQRS